MESIKIIVKNYEKYKGRSDVKQNSWFRLSNRILEDSDFFNFTHEEILCWIYFLSNCSQHNRCDIQVSLQHAHHVCRLSPPAIKSTIKKLKDLNIIEVPRKRTIRGRYADDTHTCATEQNRTDRTEQYIAHPDVKSEMSEKVKKNFELEGVYELYPRKREKSKGLKKLQAQIKTQQDYNQLVQAVKNYSKLCANTEQQYIKHFSTFANCWRDYVEIQDFESKKDPNMQSVNWDDDMTFGG